MKDSLVSPKLWNNSRATEDGLLVGGFYRMKRKTSGIAAVRGSYVSHVLYNIVQQQGQDRR